MIAVCLAGGASHAGAQADAEVPYARGPLAPLRHFVTLGIEEGLSQSTVTAIAQDHRGFIWIGTQDGLHRYDGLEVRVFRHDPEDDSSLSSSFVQELAAAPDGTLWVGTFVGLNHFDPETETFTRLPVKEFGTRLGVNLVQSLYTARDGALWVGTSGGGLSRYTTAEGFPAQDFRHSEWSNEIVSALLEDRAGDLWVGTHHGLYRMDGSNGNLERLGCAPVAGSPTSDEILSLLETEDGTLWVGCRDGLCRRAPNATTFDCEVPRSGDSCSLPNAAVRSMLQDRSGAVWVGTEEGVARLPAGGTCFEQYHAELGDPYGLRNDSVRSLFEDRLGTIWVGTYLGGVSRHDPSSVRFGHRLPPLGTPRARSVRTFLEDERGRFWIGTSAGLQMFDPRSGAVREYLSDPADPHSLESADVRALATDGRGGLWVGTEGGSLSRLEPSGDRFVRYSHDPDDPRSLSSDGVWSLLRDSRGQLWVGTRGGGLDLFDPETGSFVHHSHDPNDPESIVGDAVRVLVEDGEGIIWAGTVDAGLCALDSSRQRFRSYPIQGPGNAADQILSIHVTPDGVVWTGSYAGLHRIDRETGAAHRYGVREGLPNEVVYGILEDARGRLWLTTNRGVARFDPATEEVVSYQTSDGLQSSEFHSGATYRSSTGLLWMGGVNGFNLFDPEAISAAPTPPEVVITDLLLWDRPVQPRRLDPDSPLEQPILATDGVALDYRNLVFSFNFAALHYSDPLRNRYAYRLEGYDSRWTETDAANRRATYRQVPAGDYTFRVRAANKDGVWSPEGTSLRVRVLPSPWRSWWAYLLYGLLATGLVVGVIGLQRREVNRQRLVNRQLIEIDRLKDEFVAELERKVAERTAELEQARDQAESANRLKSDFLNMVSHDLRTPLNAILGNLRLLTEEQRLPDPGETVEIARDVSASSRHLLDLVNDLLDLSKLQAGMMELELRPVAAREVVEQALGAVEVLRREKGLSVETRIEEFELRADTVRLRQVLVNLLDNAIRQTPQGGLIVETALNGSWARFSVGDTGPGIEPELIEVLFEPFRQASPSGGAGTGLGLAICRRLVEAHGGRIEVSSEPGKGSVFSVLLPREGRSGGDLSDR